MIATYRLIHWPVQEVIEDLKLSLCFIDRSLIHIAGYQVVGSKASQVVQSILQRSSSLENRVKFWLVTHVGIRVNEVTTESSLKIKVLSP